MGCRAYSEKSITGVFQFIYPPVNVPWYINLKIVFIFFTKCCYLNLLEHHVKTDCFLLKLSFLLEFSLCAFVLKNIKLIYHTRRSCLSNCLPY